MSLNVYALGASRNIGYHATLRLLGKGATVTYLLRSPDAFKDDATMQGYIESGHARIVKGDALNTDDVAKGWAEATRDSRVDVVHFTVGLTPSSFSLRHGGILPIPDVCTRSILVLLRTMPAQTRANPPRFVVLSSTGVTKTSHDNLPLIWRPLYSWLGSQPHADKLGLERVLTRCMGQTWADVDGQPPPEILPAGWEDVEGTPAEGSLPHVVIIRPALLAGSGFKGKYRVGEEQEMKGHNGYFITREDVAHFIVEGVLADWDKYEGKRICIAN